MSMLTFWLNETRLDSLIDGVGSLHSEGNSAGNSRRNRRRSARLPVIADDERDHGIVGASTGNDSTSGKVDKENCHGNRGGSELPPSRPRRRGSPVASGTHTATGGEGNSGSCETIPMKYPVGVQATLNQAMVQDLERGERSPARAPNSRFKPRLIAREA